MLSLEEQRKVDIAILRDFLYLCRAKQVRYFGFISFVHTAPDTNNPLAYIKHEAEAMIKSYKFERMSMFRPAWIQRQGPSKTEYLTWGGYTAARLEHAIRTHFRFIWPFMYIPAAWLGSSARTVEPAVLAQAMVRDCERFLTGADAEEMRKKLGFRGLKRIYFDDMQKLAHMSCPKEITKENVEEGSEKSFISQ